LETWTSTVTRGASIPERPRLYITAKPMAFLKSYGISLLPLLILRIPMINAGLFRISRKRFLGSQSRIIAL